MSAEGKFWLELREPKCVPERKGPFPLTSLAETLREFFKARPTALISVVTLGHDGPHFGDAPETLMMCDARSRSTALRHIGTSNTARGDIAWLPIASADKEITEVVPLGDIMLRNSDRYWVRESGREPYRALWTETPARSYWWDIEGESPCDPEEFLPHPLDRARFLAGAS